MPKRILLTLIATILFISIAISSFAVGNIVNGVRNAVGGTENALEDVGNDITSGIRNGFNTMENGTENMMTDARNGMENTENTVAGMTTNGDNNGNGYTAARTSTDDTTVAGMTTNTWSWIIIGITIAAIAILVWSYIRQQNKNDIYIDSDDL